MIFKVYVMRFLKSYNRQLLRYKIFYVVLAKNIHYGNINKLVIG